MAARAVAAGAQDPDVQDVSTARLLSSSRRKSRASDRASSISSEQVRSRVAVDSDNSLPSLTVKTVARDRRVRRPVPRRLPKRRSRDCSIQPTADTNSHQS